MTAPKSTESTNSTMPAYSFVPLIFTRGGTRGGAYRLIHAGCILSRQRRLVNRNRRYPRFCPLSGGKKSVKLHHLPLTFRVAASKIDSVWCTLAQYVLGISVSLITGVYSRGKAFCALWRFARYELGNARFLFMRKLNRE